MSPQVITAIQRWQPEARKLPSDDLKIAVPLYVLLGEAVDLARFHKKYYPDPDLAAGDSPRPGLHTVDDEARGLSSDTGGDLLSLGEAVQQANLRYLLAATPAAASPIARARFLINEIAGVLDFKFDDGVDDERTARLDAVQAANADTPDSADAIAAELEDYAGLGNAYREEIDGVGNFDARLLDEARTVAEALRNRPATPVVLTDAAASALALRNRLATLLSRRMANLRSAAKFVFRHHPNIAREATSAYERRRRAAARRKEAKKNRRPPE